MLMHAPARSYTPPALPWRHAHRARAAIVLGRRAAAVAAIPPRGDDAARPLSGTLDVVARLFAEQLVTFPRFVWSGGFARVARRED